MSTNGKVAIMMTTGLEDPEQVTVALLTAVGAAEQGRPTPTVHGQGGGAPGPGGRGRGHRL